MLQEYDELVELQVKLEERLQELEANPPRYSKISRSSNQTQSNEMLYFTCTTDLPIEINITDNDLV